MASGLNKFGGIPDYRVQNISVPSVGGASNPRWSPPTVRGGGPSRYDEENTSVSEDRLARMKALNPENTGRGAREAATEQAETKTAQTKQDYLTELAQQAGGRSKEQAEARERDRQEGERIAENKQLKQMQSLAKLAHLAGTADLDEGGFRVLGPEANQLMAEMTGIGSLAISKGDEESPRIAVKLVGDPSKPGDGAMQFFVGGEGGFQPLTTGSGAPVQPMLSVVNQATALMDKRDELMALGQKGEKGTKGDTDLAKEGMSNQSQNARAVLTAAQKTLGDALTNDPDNQALVAAAVKDYQAALKQVGGAGTTAPNAAPQRGAFALQPDFDREGNPWRPSKGRAAPQAGAAAAPGAQAPQAIPAPQTAAPAARPGPGASSSVVPGAEWVARQREGQQQLPQGAAGPQLPAMSSDRAARQAAGIALENLAVHQDPQRFYQEQRSLRPSPEAIMAEQQRRRAMGLPEPDMPLSPWQRYGQTINEQVFQ